MSSSLGSGRIEYHEDRPILHFASSPEEVEAALLAHKLRGSGFQTTERMPS